MDSNIKYKIYLEIRLLDESCKLNISSNQPLIFQEKQVSVNMIFENIIAFSLRDFASQTDALLLKDKFVYAVKHWLVLRHIMYVINKEEVAKQDAY